MAHQYKSVEDIFNRVTIIDSCWIWPTKSKSGYGTVYIGGTRKNQIKMNAHRLSYELAKGKIPRGLVIDHLCRNPPCVNPYHLEAVTVKENVDRGVGPAATNLRKDKCIRGHEFGKQPKYLVAIGWRKCSECHLIAENKRRLSEVSSL